MAEAPKKPASAYFLFSNAKREEIQKMCGAKDFKTVASKTAELWKNASASEKKPFEDKVQKQKEAWEKFKETEEGQAALDAKKTERKEKKEVKTKKDAKKAVKAVEKDDKLKKPLSAYFLWLNANREKIAAEMGSTKLTEVTKKASEKWNAMSEQEKAPWEQQTRTAREEYEKYIGSDEGAAALKNYKEVTQAAKQEVLGKKPEEKKEVKKEDKKEEKKGEKSENAKNGENGEQPKKRGRTQKKEDDDQTSPEQPETKKAKGRGKGGKGAKTQKDDAPAPLAEDIKKACAAAQKKWKDAGNFETLLHKLLETEKLAQKGLTPEQGLAALEKSSGLLNKARGFLFAELGA